MYYGKLNYIEHKINGKVYENTDTDWYKKVDYKSTQKADGKFSKYGEKVLQSGNTYGNTPSIKQTEYRQWSSKFKEGTKWKQNYKRKITITLNGFLSSLKDEVFSAASTLSKDSRKWFTADYPTEATGLGTFTQPNELSYSYEDVDTEGSGKDIQIYSYSRNTKGYIKRNRIRKNLVTMEMKWTHLTGAEVAKVLQIISGDYRTGDGKADSQYIKVCYVDALTNAERTCVMINSSRNVTATYRGQYKDLTATFIEV